MPIIDLKSPKIAEIKEKCENFLKSEKFDKLVYILTLTCERCKVLAICKEPNYFICPLCGYKWEIKAKPRGYK